MKQVVGACAIIDVLRRVQGQYTRRYATAPPAASKSNWPLYLSGAGVVGLGAYVYLQRTGTLGAAKAAAAPKQEKSPLDPNNFVDLKLKKVEPYNSNTSKYVYICLLTPSNLYDLDLSLSFPITRRRCFLSPHAWS